VRHDFLAAVLVAAGCGSAQAAEARHALQGMFCNTRAQLEQVLGYLEADLSPVLAASLTNTAGVVCVYVDRLWYIVEAPITIGEHRGRVRLIKYEAKLVGVVVGGNLRPVAPAATVFFALPERLPDAPVVDAT
jgi:hypothetical protein